MPQKWLRTLLLMVGFGSMLHAAPSPAKRPRHHTYRLIDLGTFGGPTGGIQPEGNGGPYINSRGAVIGQANTRRLFLPRISASCAFQARL